MQDLLKEAIADAKAIRQVAIENAKATLAETFAPKFKKLVAEEMKDDEDSLYEEDDYSTEEEELDESLFEMEGEEDDEMMEGEDMEDSEMMEGEGEGEEEDYEEEMPEDDLEEILRELDMEGGEEDEEMMEGDDMEEPEMKAPPKEAPVMKEPSQKSDLEEFLREMLAEMEGAEEESDTDVDAMQEELESKEEELQEAYRTIKFLKSKINESLLINSKLLYSGKLFRAHNLDESQKISILETFDRATSIRETKLLYASLATTLNEIKSRVNNKSMRLKESRASKSTLNSTKPSPKVLEEGKMVSRLQQLAGIIK
jgi:hypothetical protein